MLDNVGAVKLKYDEYELPEIEVSSTVKLPTRVLSEAKLTVVTFGEAILMYPTEVRLSKVTSVKSPLSLMYWSTVEMVARLEKFASAALPVKFM